MAKFTIPKAALSAGKSQPPPPSTRKPKTEPAPVSSKPSALAAYPEYRKYLPANIDGKKGTPGAVVDADTRMTHRPNQAQVTMTSTDGSMKLDKACGEQGYRWGIVGTTFTAPGNGQQMKTTVSVLIGSIYEVTVEGDEFGAPHSVSKALEQIAASLKE